MTTETEVDEALKELGVVVTKDKQEEVWTRVVQNMRSTLEAMEKELEYLPFQIAANREILKLAESKSPVPLK